MSLYRRCRCAAEGRADCAHPWWVKFKYRGGVIRESTEQSNRRKAEAVEIRRHAEVFDRGTGLAKRKSPRLQAHIAAYLEWARGDHPTTADAIDARVLPTLLEVIGDKPLDQISAFDIDRWRTARLKVASRAGRTLSRSTVNRYLTVVRGLFHQAVEWKQLAASPVAAVEAWKTDDRPIRVLTADERVIVLTELPPLHAMLCRVTLEALLRVSEVLTLRRQDLGAESIQRRLKGGTVATIPVSRTLIADLRQWLRTPEQVYIFGDPPPGAHSTTAAMTKAFRAVGLRGISHHTMRHTGITDMLEDCVSPRAIQEYAGWTSLRMLQRYGHVRDAELRRATTGTAARNAAALAQRSATGAHGAVPAKKGAQKGAHGHERSS